MLKRIQRPPGAQLGEYASDRICIGAELSAVIMEERFEHLDAPVLRVTYPDAHCPFAQALEANNLPDANKIADAIRRLAAY